MRRAYPIFLLFFLLPLASTEAGATSTVDSLQSRLQELYRSSQKAERLEVVMELGKALRIEKSYEESIQQYQQALELALYLEQAHAHREILMNLGEVYRLQENYVLAEETFQRLVQEETLCSQQQLAEANHRLSKVYRAQGNFDLAYDYQMRALEIRRDNQDQEGVARSQYQLGSLFFFQNNYALALEYYQKTLDNALALNDQHLLYMSYGALGSTYNKLERLDLSIEYNQLALELAEAQQNEVAIAYALHNMGADYYAVDSLALALQYFSQARLLKQQLQDQWGEIASLRMMGKVYVDQGQVELGLRCLQESLKMAEELALRPRVLEAYETLAKVYEQLDQGPEAILYLRKYIALKDSLVNETTVQKMGTIKQGYEVQRREQELVKKDYQIAQLQQKALIVGILVLLILLWLIYSRYQNTVQYSQELQSKNHRIHQQNEELAQANDLQKRSNALLRKNNEKIQLQNKKLENSNLELQRFAHIASHDLKEPLRTIGAYASLVSRRYQHTLDGEGKEFLHFITQGVNRMYHLLDDVLNYSRLETEVVQPDLEWVDLNELVVELQRNLQEQILQSNARIQSNPLPWVKANRNHLYQIFQNLLVNGLKYNTQLEPQINIGWERDGSFYRFEVRDNGIGIDPSYHHKIFEAFQRLHRTDEFEGTGIGLAICKKLVTQYGGDIWVESTVGQGSAFYFSFPIPPGSQTVATSPALESVEE